MNTRITQTFSIPGHRGKEKSKKMYGWYRGKAESFRCIFGLSSLQLLCKNIGRWLSFIKSLSFDLFLSVFRRCQHGSLTRLHQLFLFWELELRAAFPVTLAATPRASSWLPSLTSLKMVSPQLGIYACVWWIKFRGGWWPLSPSAILAL
jgi:hypothetical protein